MTKSFLHFNFIKMLIHSPMEEWNHTSCISGGRWMRIPAVWPHLRTHCSSSQSQWVLCIPLTHTHTHGSFCGVCCSLFWPRTTNLLRVIRSTCSSTSHCLRVDKSEINVHCYSANNASVSVSVQANRIINVCWVCGQV